MLKILSKKKIIPNRNPDLHKKNKEPRNGIFVGNCNRYILLFNTKMITYKEIHGVSKMYDNNSIKYGKAK